MTLAPPAHALLSVDDALVALLAGVEPVRPIVQPVEAAVLATFADPLAAAGAVPPRTVARQDGWAVDAAAVVGASPYGPIPLVPEPSWVGIGELLPAGADAVLPPEAISRDAGFSEALASALPGEGVRRPGEDAAAGEVLRGAGLPVRPLDAALAQAAGVETLCVRRARVRLMVRHDSHDTEAGAAWLAALAAARGAEVERIDLNGSEQFLEPALLREGADCVVVIGNTGRDRKNGTAQAFARTGRFVKHGLALRPGGATACGTVAGRPVLLIPESLEDAVAAGLALLGPCLDRLHGAAVPQPLVRPLSRKIVSRIGLSEIVLLVAEGGAWTPLAVGDLPLAALARAEAWAILPPQVEGFPSGARLAAFAL